MDRHVSDILRDLTLRQLITTVVLVAALTLAVIAALHTYSATDAANRSANCIANAPLGYTCDSHNNVVPNP